MDLTFLKKLIEIVNSFCKNSVPPFFLQLFAVLEVIFYTTLPTIILILFSIIDKNAKNIENGRLFYIHGEFLLYSIALLSSAYTTMKVYTNKKTSFIVILIILVSISYAITIKTVEVNIREEALFWISIVASIFSVYFTWRAMSLKNNKPKSFQERDKNASDGIQEKLNFEE